MSEPIRVLIAEDDFLVSEMICSLLDELRYRTVGRTATGREAVERVLSLRPDVILMDIKMPDMDGIEATMLIQEQCPTPVVVLTAYESEDLARKSAEAGVGAYLVKPPRAGELDRAILIARARFDDLKRLQRLNAELEIRNRELREALAQVKVLRGLLPICSYCKKVRDDRGYWHRVEEYIQSYTDAQFSHGICPTCLSKVAQEIE